MNCLMTNQYPFQKPNIYFLAQVVLTTICVTGALLFVGYTLINSETHDFGVYYYSAKAALNGSTVYTVYGPYELPYWYFPWLSWFFIPLVIFPIQTAYFIYIGISVFLAWISINFLAQKFDPNRSILDRLLIFSMSLLLCWLVSRVGQMDFILLTVAVWMVHLIDREKPFLAGALVPILLFKPHLFIIFMPFAALKGKRSFVVNASIIVAACLVASTIVIPDWLKQMMRLLAQSGQRTDNNWGFTTFPNMLGWQENWSGTANLPFVFVLIVVGMISIWWVRNLPTFPLLALALAASLFCAPRAYSYNFPLLLPALIWVTAGLKKPWQFAIWIVVGVVPFWFRFSSGSYSIVLAVFIASLFKAYWTQKHDGIVQST